MLLRYLAALVVGASAGYALKVVVRALDHVALPSLAHLAAVAQVLELPISVVSLVVAALAYRRHR